MSAPWCWTKSMVNEPSFILKPTNGGMNWAFCMEDKVSPPTKYVAIVDTSTLPESETNSVIKIQIFGEKGKADEVDLNINGFDKGVSKKLEFESKEVGDLQKIRLRLDGKQFYRCKNILIMKGPKRYNFQCLRPLGPCTSTEPKKCILDIEVDGHSGYEVTIKTGDAPTDGTTSPVTFNLIGKKAKGQKKLLSEKGFKPGSSETITVYSTPVGIPVGFTVGLENKGKWKPLKVDIKDLENGKSYTFNLDNTLVINPGNSPYSYDSSVKAAKPAETPASEGVTDSMDKNNPNGGLMTPEEKKELIDLKCDQPMVNPDPETNYFGPDYPTKDVNYSKVIVRCPANCWKLANIVVYGMGIHPEASPICMSAIVDHAISIYGGIFAISIYPALDKYELPEGAQPKIHGIILKPFTGVAKKSYVLAKIDNVDLVEKDIRILNHAGELSNQGRVEMRYEGMWGTICSLGNNKQSAKRICLDIGYKDGEWLSPDGSAGKNFCKIYNNENYCGAPTTKILFTKITCEPNDPDFNKCNKFLADPDECSHQFDAIIRCYNDNFASEVVIPDKTIRLENSKAEGEKITGRIELYYAQKWQAICNIGFNKQSAIIACKQLGYTEGDVIIEAPKIADFMQKDATKGFSADNLSCKGTEDKIEDCKMNLHNVNCKHDQDVVIVCNGTKGDVTGKSQYIKKSPVPAPKLGKLAIPKRTVTCSEKGWEKKYRGDPGSTFIIKCPGGCNVVSGSIWGTGIFTSDTYICRAAIHAGVIGSTGGTFLYIKTYGQKVYSGRTMNGLRSATSNKTWPSSFTFSQMTIAWNNHNSLLGASFMSINEESRLIDENNSQIQIPEYYPSSFLEMGSQMEMMIQKPIFEWIPPSYNFKFEKSSEILLEKHTLVPVNDYTIVFSFSLQELSQEYSETFLFSYSGCGGFNIIITKQGSLTVGDYCDKNLYYIPGYIVPLNDLINVYIRYQNSKLSIKILSEKVKTVFSKYKTVNLEIKEAKNIGIGRLATNNKGWFTGTINFFQIYKGEISPDAIETIAKNINVKNNDVVEVFKKTTDSRLCVSRCSVNPIPPTPGCGEPPKEADINGTASVDGPDVKPQGISPTGETPTTPPADKAEEAKKKAETADEKKKPEKKGSDDDTPAPVSTKAAAGKDGVPPVVPPVSDASKPGGTGTYNRKKVNALESNEIDCDVNLLNPKFVGLPGKVFKAKCPNCSSISKAMVYGTSIYHPRSSICKAAQHAGIIAKGQGGFINILIITGKEIYNGSQGVDGTMSATFAAGERSFGIQTSVKTVHLKCADKASEGKYAQAAIGESFVAVCPLKCGKEIKEIVWGTQVYTDNSPICISAIHRGIINDQGGEVKFVITKGMSAYKGTNGFGITSKEFGPHIRSYEFLGLRSSLYKKYTEEYKGLIGDNWLQENHPIPIDAGTNNWAYFNNPDFINAKGVKEPLIGIRHIGTISANAEYNYGSWISLKNTEFANGTVKFNFILKHNKPIAMFFRYKDKNNLYGIQFDATFTSGNVKLFKKVEGYESLIAVQSKPFALNKWYRVTVSFNFEKVFITVQSDEIREHKVLFDQKIQGLHRGTVAFATKGNNDFIINGIHIGRTSNENKLASNDANKFTWKSILAQTNKNQRRHYCFDLFMSDKLNQGRCMRPHIYCRYRCDGLIPKIENILNYNCFSDCIRETKLELIGPVNRKPAAAEKVNFMVWKPTLEEKCDYKPSGEATFVPATVKELITIEKRQFAKIEYAVTSGEKRLVNVEYPNVNLLKCAQGLTIRTDCGA